MYKHEPLYKNLEFVDLYSTNLCLKMVLKLI